MRNLLSLCAVAAFAACGCDKDRMAASPATAPKPAVTVTPEPAPAVVVETPKAVQPVQTVEATPVAVETPKAVQPVETAAAAPTPDAPPYNPTQAGSVAVKGTALFKGDRPKRERVDMSKDEKCVAMHTKPPLTEQEIVNKDSMGIKNVFVYVTKGYEGKMSFKTPGEAVKITQDGCTYKPRVLGVMPGQKIDIVNNDSTTHNVHGLPKKSKDFNDTQNKQGATNTYTLDNAEEAVFIKCDIHPWMKAWAFVLPHTLTAVTDENGAFTLPALPPGDYEITFWHEVYGTKKQNVTVKAGMEAVKVEFSK